MYRASGVRGKVIRGATAILLSLPILGPRPCQAHFAFAPKLTITPVVYDKPETVLVRVGKLTASRADFGAYIRRLTAFDTKYDRVQPSLSAHFGLVRALALFHPQDVHAYLARVEEIRGDEEIRGLALSTWFLRQAEMFGYIEAFAERARARGVQEEAATRAVIDLYTAGAKAEFLEELVVLGEMDPTVGGVRDFLTSLPSSVRADPPTRIEQDQSLSSPEEQRRMRSRWIAFRRDAIKTATISDNCGGDLDEVSMTPLLQVNEHRMRADDYAAIFGAGSHRRGPVKANCRRVALFWALADVSDALGIGPRRVQEKVRTTHRLFLAAKQLVRELELRRKAGTKSDLGRVRELQSYPRILETKASLLSFVETAAADIDRSFISSVPWQLGRVLAPKHSIHL
ncbi:MAG: hypothetical protein AAFZ18_12360 [Myxococcota bacterium]